MILRRVAIVALACSAAGCSVVAGIFKAGFSVGIIVAIVVVVGLTMLLRRR